MPAQKVPKNQERQSIKKFVKNKPANEKTKREKNQFYFRGFYERLKSLDVKQSHSLDMLHNFDALVNNQEDLIPSSTSQNGISIDMIDESKTVESNFIEYLRTEKMNNRTIDFKRVYDSLDPLSYSHALVLLNRKTILSKLLSYLRIPAEGNSDSVLKGNIIELIIALIKDLRQEIYTDFVQLIMPTVIQTIDMQDLKILDKVFTLFSFSFKYLLKQIREDIQYFYSIFHELLIHKSKHLRHFAAQSFSYVLRKVQINHQIMEMILSPLNNIDENSQNVIMGISDIFFEVMYGTSQDLHSKAGDLLDQLLQYEVFSEAMTHMIRHLFIKLFNSIDSAKQRPLFLAIHNNLIFKKQLFEQQVQLGLLIIQDSVKLKFGRRLSHLSVLQIIDSLNLLMQNQKQNQLALFSDQMKEILAETISCVFYFKHQSVVLVFQQSQIDLSSSKTIFTNQIYKTCLGSIDHYFKIFLQNPAEIQAGPSLLGLDADYNKILGLKTNHSQGYEFTSESHASKLKYFIPSLNAQVQQHISQDDVEDNIKTNLITLFNLLSHIFQDNFVSQFELSSEAQVYLNQKIQKLKSIDQNINAENALIIYNMVKYQNLGCFKKKQLQESNQKNIKNQVYLCNPLQLNLGKIIEENQVLKNYKELQSNQNNFQQNIIQLLDIQNGGYMQDIEYQTHILTNSNKQQALLNPSNILLLRNYHEKNISKKFNFQENIDLFEALTQNLIKNSRQVRLATLKLLIQFEQLKYLEPQDSTIELSENFKDQYCNCIQLMYDFEITDISFAFEKDKEMKLRSLEVIMKQSCFVPSYYTMLCYNFFIGCLWIKFTPLQSAVHDCICALLSNCNPDIKGVLIQKHTEIMKTVQFISQFQGHSNEGVVEIINKCANKSILAQQNSNAETYLKDTLLKEEYLEVRDFFYQVSQSVANILGSVILPDKIYKSQLFSVFYQFINEEYKLISNYKNFKWDEENQENVIQILADRMTQANLLDSQAQKQYRRTTYSTLAAYLEMFRRSDNLKQIPQIGELQSILRDQLSSVDTKMQKCALECLSKSGYLGGLIRKYQKLLEGFCDDEKFKDMIPIMVYGTQARPDEDDVAEEYLKDTDDKMLKKMKKKETKSKIPKLDQEDRAKMLPIIIKLLQSKLKQKKGVINKKSIFVRRNLIYQFMATFDKNEEFPLIINELLSPFSLSLEIINEQNVLEKLTMTSFNVYVTFVNQFETMLKQMGQLLIENLPALTIVLVRGVIKLSKIFIKQIKKISNEDVAKKDFEDELQGDASDITEDDEEKDQVVYYNAGQQAKDCLRKSLGLVKQIYKKFSFQDSYITQFSQSVFEEVISDQLGLLKQNYICDKSQLLEIICDCWIYNSNNICNYGKYPNVFPATIDMLSHENISYDVAALHIGLLKNLILFTVDVDGQKSNKNEFEIDRIKATKEILSLKQFDQEYQQMNIDTNDIDSDGDYLEETRRVNKDLSTEILISNIDIIIMSLKNFWNNHNKELKQILSTNASHQSNFRSFRKDVVTQNALLAKEREQQKKFHVAKDMLFILSELSNYIEQNSSFAKTFLEMIVSIISIRNLHNQNKHNQDLLMFGIRCIQNLMPKIKQGELNESVIDQITSLFLHIKCPKIRCQLSIGVDQTFSQNTYLQSLFSKSITDILKKLNKAKRGVADVELDCNQAIIGIQEFIQYSQQKQTQLKNHEINCIAYCILYICQHEEFSLREYGLHGLNHIFNLLKNQQDRDHVNRLVYSIETQIIRVYLVKVKDELILKTILQCLKSLIVFVSDNKCQSQYKLNSFRTLCNTSNSQNNEDNEDFFSNILSIKLKQRQKCLKNLKQSIEAKVFEESIKSLEIVILPLVEYLVFSGETQLQNKRNTISYDKEQKRSTIEEALNVFTAFSQQLSWNDYFKLLKKYLYRLQRASSKVNKISSYGQPELQKEKVITKAICKVLAGFNFIEVPDAIEALKLKEKEIQMKNQGAKENNIFGHDFQELIQQSIQEKDTNLLENNDKIEYIIENEIDDIDYEILDDIEENSEGDEKKQERELQISQDQQSQKPINVQDIQQKLLQKVLPILEKHLTEKGDKFSVRSFVAVCYVKIIRKLPLQDFNMYFRRLINLIVTQGLRSKDLSHREKARKALSKIVDEVSPRFLSLIFDEMKNQLTLGYQLHVYLFSIHHLLSSLAESGALTPGIISNKVVDQNIDIMLSELFGDLNIEKSNEQNNELKMIKESKHRKAVSIFEILTEYVNFQTGFLNLLAPIINILDKNPSFSKIQQCEDLLSRISTSLIKNKTTEHSHLLLFLYSIIDKGIQMSIKVKINDEKQKRDYGAAIGISTIKKTKAELRDMNMTVEMYWDKNLKTISSKKSQEISGRVLAAFGLQCLKKVLKQKNIQEDQVQEINQKQKQEFIERYDPFVLLILNSFKTYHNPIIVTSLHIMTQIMGIGLPNFKEHLGRFLSRIFKLFEQAQSSDSDFINSLFKCTSELVKTYSIYQDLSQVQIKSLVQIIRSHINKYAVQSNCLQCLRSVVHRKFMCVELYDLIEVVQEMMISNNQKQIRGLCSSIFIQFLLDYPLQNERVESHINFLLKNLGYKQIENRIQLLQIFQTLIERLPSQVVEVYGELIFFTLLLRVVNDDNSSCREQVQQVMRTLIFSNKINQSKIKNLLNTVLKMGSEDPQKKDQLKLAKLHALKLLAESGKDNSNKLKSQEIDQIIETASKDAIIVEIVTLQNEVQKIQAKKRSYSQTHEESSEDEKTNQFLKAIDLMDDKEDHLSDDEQQTDVGQQESTLLFHALSCMEKLLEYQQKSLVIELFKKVSLVKNLIFMIQHHQSFWIRYISQRILSQIFQYQRESKSNLVLVLGIDIPEQLADITFDLIDSLKRRQFSQEMQSLSAKNIVFMFNDLLEKQQDDESKDIQICKIYKKITFIGRKVMQDILTSKDRLETILQLLKTSLELLKIKFEDSKTFESIIRNVCPIILNLVCRINSDKQYTSNSDKSSQQIQENSNEIEQFFQNNIESGSYIELYSKVKLQIIQKRQQRKIKQKLLPTSEQGIATLQKKRIAKYTKKKQNKQNRIFKQKLINY